MDFRTTIVKTLLGEKVEHIDELSKETLKSYGDKAYPDAVKKSADAHDKVFKHIEKTGKAPSTEKEVMKIAGKEITHAAKRTQGLARATTKLAKEEVIVEKVLDTLSPTKHGDYTVTSKVLTHPDEKVYNTNTLVHKGTIKHKDDSLPSKFEAHIHVNRGVEFKTKHSPEERKAITQHLDKHKQLTQHNKKMTEKY
jgi:hypothetical protein